MGQPTSTPLPGQASVNANKLREKLGIDAGDALPSHTGLGCYPLVYLYHNPDWPHGPAGEVEVLCHKCVTEAEVESGKLDPVRGDGARSRGVPRRGSMPNATSGKPSGWRSS